MSILKEKKLTLAIVLNLVLPGLGYLIYGKRLVAVATGLIMLAIYFTATLNIIIPTWFLVNLVMLIDLLIPTEPQIDGQPAQMAKCANCDCAIEPGNSVCERCSSKLQRAFVNK